MTPAETLAVRSWEDAIAHLEQLVAGQRRSVAQGAYTEVRSLTVPTGLGVVPPHLSSRAQALLAQLADLESDIAGRLEADARPPERRHRPVARPGRFS